MKHKILFALFLIYNLSNCIVTEFYEREVARDVHKKYGDLRSEFEKGKYILPGYEVRNEQEEIKFLYIDGALVKEKQANRFLKIKMYMNGITDIEIEEVKKMSYSEKVSYLINESPLHMWDISRYANSNHLPKWQREYYQKSIPADIRNLITQKPINLLYYQCFELEVGCKVQSYLVKKNSKGEVTVIQEEEFSITKREINHVNRFRFHYILVNVGYLVTLPIDVITFPLQAVVFIYDTIVDVIECQKKQCLRGIIPG